MERRETERCMLEISEVRKETAENEKFKVILRWIEECPGLHETLAQKKKEKKKEEKGLDCYIGRCEL